MKKIFLFISVAMIFVFLLSTACNRMQINWEKCQSNAAMVKELNSSGEFITDKAEFWNRKIIRKAEKDLGLDSLDNGFDSIQIRIWYGCPLGEERLVVLTYKSNKWSGEISRLTYNYSINSNEYDSLSRELCYKEPQSGWDNFIFNLFNLKILSLPLKEKVPGLWQPAAADGCGVGVEVASKNIYRFYQYDIPDTTFQETRDIMSILRIIEDEFNLDQMFDSQKNIDSSPLILIPKEIVIEKPE